MLFDKADLGTRPELVQASAEGSAWDTSPGEPHHGECDPRGWVLQGLPSENQFVFLLKGLVEEPGFEKGSPHQACSPDRLKTVQRHR